MPTPVSISANYSGRTLDLLIFQMPGQFEGNVSLSLGDKPKACTGIQKIAQNYTVTFLTRLGSVLADQTFGTDTIGAIGVYNIIPETLRREAEVSVFEAYTQIRDSQQDEITAGVVYPNDEILTNAELVDLTVSGDTIKFVVQLTTAAGTSRQYVLPVPVNAGLQ